MKTSSAGYTLLECMVYCVLVAVITTLISSVISFSVLSLRSVTQEVDRLSMFQVACDVFSRDCGCAPKDTNVWTARSSTHIAWNDGVRCVAWYLKGTRLMRTECGSEKRKAVLLDGVEKIDFHLHYRDDRVCAVGFLAVVLGREYRCLRAIVP